MLCFFCFARFKASRAHCFIHRNWGLWLLAANTKYSRHAGLSCGRILQQSCCCDHQIHLSRRNRSRSFLEKCLVLLYGTALWISERWHRQPLKRASSGLKTRRRVAVVHQRISRSFFVTSVSWMFASFCVHIQLLWLHVCIPGCRILEYAECMNGCRIQTGWSLCCFFNVTAFTGAEVFPCYRSALPTRHGHCLNVFWNTRFVNLVLPGFRLCWRECILSLDYVRGVCCSSVATCHAIRNDCNTAGSLMIVISLGLSYH